MSANLDKLLTADRLRDVQSHEAALRLVPQISAPKSRHEQVAELLQQVAELAEIAFDAVSDEFNSCEWQEEFAYATYRAAEDAWAGAARAASMWKQTTAERGNRGD